MKFEYCAKLKYSKHFYIFCFCIASLMLIGGFKTGDHYLTFLGVFLLLAIVYGFKFEKLNIISIDDHQIIYPHLKYFFFSTQTSIPISEIIDAKEYSSFNSNYIEITANYKVVIESKYFNHNEFEIFKSELNKETTVHDYTKKFIHPEVIRLWIKMLAIEISFTLFWVYLNFHKGPEKVIPFLVISTFFYLIWNFGYIKLMKGFLGKK